MSSELPPDLPPFLYSWKIISTPFYSLKTELETHGLHFDDTNKFDEYLNHHTNIHKHQTDKLQTDSHRNIETDNHRNLHKHQTDNIHTNIQHTDQFSNQTNTRNDLHSLISRVARSIHPTPRTAYELVCDPSPSYLQTPIPSLNEKLHGGISCGAICEIVGCAGSGKTQWALTLSWLCIRYGLSTSHLPSQSNTQYEDTPRVLYVDTENISISDRWVQICQARATTDDSTANSIANSPFAHFDIRTITDFNSLHQFIQEDLQEIAINYSMIIVDSIANLIRIRYGSDSKEILQRENSIVAQATKLKYIAENFRIPIVITNHVTVDGNFSRSNFTGITPEQTLRPALGNTWAHCVNTRLVLEEATVGRKTITVDKSPQCGRYQCGYKVEHGGVCEDVSIVSILNAQGSTGQIRQRNVAQGTLKRSATSLPPEEPPFKKPRL